MRSILSLLAVLTLGAAAAPAHAASAPNLQSPDTVVVSRGDAHITFRDIDDFMQRVPADKRAGALDNAERIQNMLLSMLLNEQLAAQAVQMGLDKDPEVQGKTGWERIEVLSKLRVQRFMAAIAVPDLEVLAHEEYIAHKDRYSRPGAVQVQRIFVSSAQLDDKQAWNRADDIHKQAVAAPDRFAALVAQYSDDPDKGQTQGLIHNGDGGTIDRWMTEALRSLHRPGEITNVLPTEGGYQIGKLVSIAPDVPRPFAEVHDAIVESLRQNYIETTRQDFIDHLASEKMDADPEAVASLRTRYAGAALGRSEPAAAPQAPSGSNPNASKAHP